MPHTRIRSESPIMTNYVELLSFYLFLVIPTRYEFLHAYFDIVYRTPSCIADS